MILLALALLSAPVLSGQIAGTVLAEPGSEPVARAELSLSVTINGESFSALAYSDSSGRFRFDNLPPGRYWLSARRSGYPGVRRYLSLKSGESLDNLTLRFARSSSVSGKVTTLEGDALPNSFVQLFKPAYYRGERFWTQAANAVTNDRGEYRISGFAPGSYRLRASSLSVLRLLPFNSDLRALSGTPRFFPSSPDANSASAIDVASGNDVSGINVLLPLERTATLRLRLSGIPENTNAGASVRLIPESGVLNESNSAPIVRMFGERVEVSEVTPGHYRLFVQMGSHTANVPTTVSGDTEMSIGLVPPVEVAGTVRFEGENSAKKPNIRVKIASGEHFLKQELTAEASGEQNRFVLNGVTPGVWDIGVEPMPAGGYIKSVTFGGKDVLVDDMVVTPENRGPLHIVVSSRGATLTGEVDREAGTAILAPWGPRRNAWGLYHAVEIKVDGSFSIGGVTPGEYRVFAMEEFDEAATQDAGFLNGLAEWGVPVKFAEGGTASLKVRMIPPDLLRNRP